MNRKSMIAVTLTFTMLLTAMTGCGNKETTPKKTANEVASVETTVKNVKFSNTELGNVIANDPVLLSDLLYAVTPEKGQTVKTMTISYGSETVTLEDKKDLKTDTKAFTVVKNKDAKELFDKKNVPNVNIKFTEVTKAATDLKVMVSLVDKDKKTSKASVSIKVMVLPETVKPVKAITQNLKLSESLKDYDFDVRAKNIADTAVDTIESIKVKESNVTFGKAGHYEVSYEIKTKPTASKLEVPTDVEVVDKATESTLPKDEVISENVTVTTTVDVVDKSTENSLPKDEVIKDSTDTKAPVEEPKTDGSTASGDSAAKPSDGGESAQAPSGDAGGSTASGGSSGGSTASGGSSGGGSAPAPAPAPTPTHSHSWAAHTATKNVWVPNIVTVTDYGTQAAHSYDSRCGGCGAVFGSAGECSDHQLAGCSGGRQNIACSHTTQVVTGSHTEDHGYNTSESYTDYEYCGCGATR